MTRANAFSVSLLGLALAVACTPAPNILPTNDLNRPTDIAFMCLGGFDKGNGSFEVSGRPMRHCHPPAEDDMHKSQPLPALQNRTFAFVPNSASGDLSVIDADNWKIVDLDKSTSGYGRVPLGTLPEQISATTDGCRLVSANRGSCDLTLVDPSTLLAGTLAAQYNSASVNVSVPPGNGLQRIHPHWPDGTPEGKPLDLAPYEAVFLPRNIAALTDSAQLCSETPTTPWRALVTFPSCDLITLVDFPTGEVVAAAKVEKDPADSTKIVIRSIDPKTPPTCPVDCAADRAPDGGVPDAGAPSQTIGTFGPTGIAIFPRGDHAYVSLAKQSAIVSFALTAATITPMKTVDLETAGGSNRIRLGVDPWAVPNGDYVGKFISSKDVSQQYLYVIARDGSLRIVDVLDPGQEHECATNFDPLNPQKYATTPVDVTPQSRCIPYDAVNRRQYSGDATTTGLRFPAIPIDVAAAHMTGDAREETVNGGYAWVLTSSGTIYLVNINPDPRSIKAVVHQSQTELFPPTEPSNPFPLSEEAFAYKSGGDATSIVHESTPFPNRPRDRNVMSYSVSLDPSLGPTRLDLPPLGLPTGPYIESLWTQGTEDDATALDVRPRRTAVFFPDRDAAVAQGWDVTWQGTIVGARFSAILNGSTLRDGQSGLCSAGVLPGDIVTLRGCNTTADCPLGLICDRDQSLDKVAGGFTVTGLCISANLQASLASQCAPFKSSVRHYEIAEAFQDHVILTPHLDEVVRSSLSPCTIAGLAGTTGTAGTGGASGTAGTGGMSGMGGDPTGTGGMGGDAGTLGSAGTGGGAGMAGAGGSGGSGGSAGASGTGGTSDSMLDCADPTDPSTQPPPRNSLKGFECVAYNGQRRCLNRCGANQDCRAGRICLPTCANGADCASGVCTEGLCHARPGPKNKGDADLNACNPSVSCQPGEACVNNQCKLPSFCADGPPLTNDMCFPQLTSYQVNVNAGFMVTGAQAGSLAAGTTDKDGHCKPDAGRDRRLVSRIPLRPYPGQDPAEILCEQPMHPVFPKPTKVQETILQTTSPFDGDGPPPAGKPIDPSGDGYYIDHFDPALEPTLDMTTPGKLADVSGVDMTMNNKVRFARPEAPQLVEWMKTWTRDVTAPNACLYLGGPIASDIKKSFTDPTTRKDRDQHVRARFRNTQVAFLLADIERGPPTGITIHFDVHGGFRQEAVVNLTTVEVSAPARIVLGPIDSTRVDMVPDKAAPYFFVVDQRRLGRGQGGGPTRGQIVRVNPFGFSSTNGFLPVYEDYHASNALFPIQ